MYVQNRGWQTELLNVNETELGGYKEISFMVTGAGAWSRLKYESGVHRVQRVPKLRRRAAFIPPLPQLLFCPRQTR
jgi:peptide chain release factor 1